MHRTQKKCSELHRKFHKTSDNRCSELHRKSTEKVTKLVRVASKSSRNQLPNLSQTTKKITNSTSKLAEFTPKNRQLGVQKSAPESKKITPKVEIIANFEFLTPNQGKPPESADSCSWPPKSWESGKKWPADRKTGPWQPPGDPPSQVPPAPSGPLEFTNSDPDLPPASSCGSLARPSRRPAEPADSCSPTPAQTRAGPGISKSEIILRRIFCAELEFANGRANCSRNPSYFQRFSVFFFPTQIYRIFSRYNLIFTFQKKGKIFWPRSAIIIA